MNCDSKTRDETRIRLNPVFVPVKISSDELVFATGPLDGPKHTMRDEDREGVLEKLPPLLDGTRTIREILDEFDSKYEQDILGAIEQLLSEEILQVTASHDQPLCDLRAQAARAPTAKEQIVDLDDKSVTVVASGVTGHDVAANLVATEIGTVRLLSTRVAEDIDSSGSGIPDTVEHVSAEQPLRGEIKTADLVVFATDQSCYPLIQDLNEIANELSVPLLPVQMFGTDGFVGPGIIPGKTACYRCFERRVDAHGRNRIGFSAWDRAVNETDEGNPVPPAIQGILSGYAAVHAQRMLAFGTAFIVGRILHIDAVDLDVKTNSVLIDPRCDVCGGGDAGPDTQRFVRSSDLIEDRELFK